MGRGSQGFKGEEEMGLRHGSGRGKGSNGVVRQKQGRGRVMYSNYNISPKYQTLGKVFCRILLIYKHCTSI